MIKRILSLTLSFLLLASNSFAAIKFSRFDFFNNSGGLNDAFSPASIENNEAQDLQNIVLSTYGSFATRDGYEKLNSSTLGASITCTGLKYYAPTSGTKYLVGIFDDDKIYKMDYQVGGGPDGTWDDITGTASFLIGQNNLASFAVGEDTLLIEDGLNTTPPFKYTGSGSCSILSASAPNATLIAYHKNMAFAGGNNTYPSTLYFSDLGDITNWSTGISGNLSIETNDGSIIRAIIPGFDALYIFKDYSIWRLTGNDKDSFQLQRMISGTGCRSPTAVKRIGNDFFFVDGQGNVYIYDGAIKLRNISSKVQGTIDNASFSRWQYVVTEQFNEDYYISFSNTSMSTHDRILLFDSYNLGWTKFVGIKANAICVADDGVGQDMLVFGDYGGFVYKYPSGEDDAGTAISAYYTTKQFSFPELNPEKDWKVLNIYANQKGNYNLNVELRKDFGTTGTVETMSLLGSSASLYGSAIYGTSLYGGQNLIIGRIEPNLAGNFFAIKFYNSSLDEPFEVKGYQIFVESSDRI